MKNATLVRDVGGLVSSFHPTMVDDGFPHAGWRDPAGQLVRAASARDAWGRWRAYGVFALAAGSVVDPRLVARLARCVPELPCAPFAVRAPHARAHCLLLPRWDRARIRVRVWLRRRVGKCFRSPSRKVRACFERTESGHTDGMPRPADLGGAPPRERKERTGALRTD